MKASTMPRRPAYSRSTSYSHYQSNYRGGRQPSRLQKKSNRHGHAMVGLVLCMVVGLGVFVGFRSGSSSTPSKSSEAAIVSNQNRAVAAAPATNHCADNTLDKFIKIGISQRHLWACEGHKTVYDTPVITGIENHEETKTPTGTYKIYGKTTDTTLTGKDSTGSWSDPVSYWMPFLDNQHGTYGFHDATWRNDNEFGNVDPNSEQGSHGCVELPLGASKWLYNWSPVGTTLSVEN
jgi:hypothetical protein